jgi:hypothetical protein
MIDTAAGGQLAAHARRPFLPWHLPSVTNIEITRDAADMTCKLCITLHRSMLACRRMSPMQHALLQLLSVLQYMRRNQQPYQCNL